MWEESIILPIGLMVVTTIVFYKLNVHFLYDGQVTVLMWLAAGVPILVISLVLLAVNTPPPRSYAAIAGLLGLSNGLLGFGLKLLRMRWSQGRR